jgi:Fe-S oxidoreductase
MCPSYRATKNEKDTTRARANMLRDVLTNNTTPNKFDSKELKEVLDLCLSCKACASECPSNVDIATMKAEFLYQYQETNGYSFRSKLFAKSTNFNKIASRVPKLYNAISQNKITASFIKKITGVHHKRDLPRVSKSLSSFIKLASKIENRKVSVENPIKKVFLYIDEFTNYLDTEIGKDALILLESLNYEVFPIHHLESGRTYISKGFLKDAVKITNQNINFFKDLITDKTPLIGIEPSAILTFRDEYIRLADDKISAEKIAKNTFTFEEFLAKELENENIDTSLFTSVPKTLKVHGHCHQKALSGTFSSFQMLSIPDNYAVTILNTGCCGMAGSFGYEKEHYEVSMQVGEDTLFPKVRNCSADTEIAAAGTSCRHQIFDGTKRIAKHPITLLKEALL